MEERKDFEDIISDTSLNTDGFTDISSASKPSKHKHYSKKKHGIAGFFQRMGKGWKKLKPWKKGIIITATSLILVVAIIFGVILNIFDYNYNNITNDPEDLGFDNVIDKKIVNIALFGIDSRSDGFSGNSDSIMVLSINTQTKHIKIVSILRDSLVRIEQNGKIKYRKINSAYQSGGPKLAIKTLNQNFGLDITEYATVNFYGMAEIIDAVGGIDADLVAGEVVTTDKSIYALNGCISEICQKLGKNPYDYYIFEPGVHHLNGIQAVAYSRIRKTKNVWGTNDDYGRTDRQRYVMEQLFNKALTMKKTEYVKLAKALMPYTETSLSYTEIMGLAFDILLKSPTFEQSRVPLTKYQMSGLNIKGVGSCVYYDLDYVTDLLHAYFYEDIKPEDYIAANGVTKNDWYRQEVGTGNITSSSSGTSSSSTSEPETSEPETSEPETSEPETSQPDTSTPEASEPEETESEKTESDDGKTDENNQQGGTE